MGAIVAVLVGIVIIGAEVGAAYWISTRTGLYRWAQEQVGPPRRDTRYHTRVNRLGPMFLCFVMLSIPLQGGLISIAGIAAAVGIL
jgi:hypothetical protein